jgi:hypothetical protein
MLSWCSIGGKSACLSEKRLVPAGATWYPAAMTNRLGPQRLLSTARVKTLLTAEKDHYGRDFAEAEWAAITERLEALARLVWKVSQRQAREAHAEQGPTRRPGLRKERQTGMPGEPGSR